MASVKDSIVHYFQESYLELRKVTWPTRHKAVRLTFIVIGFCIVSGAFLGAVDLAFNTGYRLLVNFGIEVAPPTTAVTEIQPPAVTSQETEEVTPITTSQSTQQENTSSSSQSQQKSTTATSQQDTATKPASDSSEQKSATQISQ